MPSHLTRVVFRSIIANEPLFYRGCRHRAIQPCATIRHGARSLPSTQRRTFFNMFKSQRKLKAMEMPAGLEKLTEVAYAYQNAIRPPKPQEVAEAFKEFFAQRKGTFEEFHVIAAHNALSYLVKNPKEGEEPWLSAEELYAGTFVRILDSAHRPERLGRAHLEFGRALLSEIEKIAEKTPEVTARDYESRNAPGLNIKLSMVRLLTLCGASTEAIPIVVEFFMPDSKARPLENRDASFAWMMLLKGLAGEGNMEEMLKTAKMIEDLSIPVAKGMQRELVNFFIGQKDLVKAKFWYSYPVVSTGGKNLGQPSGATSGALLKACALHGDLTFGQQVVTTLLKDKMPDKESWDAIFLWSAAIGKGADEVDRMMNVLVRRNDEARQKNPTVELIRPDIDTINDLIRLAIERDDAYTAERFLALGEKRGIPPNEETFSMQMQYRMTAGDLDGARSAYFDLQGCFSGAEHSVSVMNKFIQVLCVARQQHFDDLMAMVDDLHERKANFAPETVAALVLLHLRRGEIRDAQDLLQVHAHQYSPEQRKIIQNALSTFILDGGSSTADAWDGYQILRNVFPETSKADRMPIMNAFFERNRSDMACHVFFHMRNHASDAHRADRDVYVAAFTGFARCVDAESLELAHNQLKLDMSVNMDTKLRNALMLAYAATGENRKALQFWAEICESKEGPSYNSLAIVFRACEGMHFGEQHAKTTWTRLIEQDVEIDKTIWTSYMSAIARNHNHDEALALIETVEEEYGFKPDLTILGNWFNSTASNENQAHVEAWIKERYPQIWKELEALGHWVTMEGFGYRQFNINRDLDP